MNISVTLNGAAPAIAMLTGAPSKIHQGWKQGAYAVGARSVALMKAKRRQVTAVRSGAAVRSYGHTVTDVANGVELAIGAIVPSEGGKVPLHVRVQEGFNAAGVRVSQFIIRPVRAPYLWFPIRNGAGLAKSTIVSWVKTKQVILKPTPVVEPVAADIPDALRAVCGEVFHDVLTAA